MLKEISNWMVENPIISSIVITLFLSLSMTSIYTKQFNYNLSEDTMFLFLIINIYFWIGYLTNLGRLKK